ncbi:MAG: hypothetical protein HYW91_03640, partial [Candidatus Sungbacteria bacterium]|nr:hypothetical protein [Candidatus Sungbacteria bacterium]
KIPPLDLRKVTPPTHKAMAGKSERMREAIFAPPIEPEEKPKETPAPEKPATESGQPKPSDSSTPLAIGKKAPYGGYDPYKEPVE